MVHKFWFDMKVVTSHQWWVIVPLLAFGIFFASCSGQAVASADSIQRFDMYVNSENIHIAEMFSDGNSLDYCGVQPALTQKEADMLDALANRISPEVRRDFDQKYTAWLNCWAPLDSIPVRERTARQLLKCNGAEFQELIEFCKQQNDEIFLLLYQLAVRAQCPYDQLLLHPVNDLLGSFPEFNQYWKEVNLALQREKPDSKNRTCNEPTIWHTRKILETKYGYTYPSGLTAIFDTQYAE
jgi:hypothetical protein